MSWKKFVSEATATCRNKEVPYAEIEEWIHTSIPNVKKEISGFLISVGPTPKYKTLLVDIHILTDSVLHEFTVFKKEKEHSIYQLKAIIAVWEHVVQEEFLQFQFFANVPTPVFYIEVGREKWKEGRAFTHEILTKWG